MSVKRISRRDMLKMSGTLAAASFLAACAPAAPAPAPTAKPQEAAPTAAKAAAPTAAPAVKGKTTVRYAQVIGPLKQQVEMYNAQSDKVNVEFELVPWGQHADKLLIDVAAGTAPDVWFIGGPWWTQIKRKSIALALDDMLKASKVDMSGFNHPPTSEWETFNGKIYGLPTNGVIMRGLGYEEDLFKVAGVDLPTKDWTLATVAAVGPKLHKPPDSYAMTAPTLVSDLWLTMIRQNGGSVVSEDEKTCLLDRPEVIEVVQACTDWRKFSMQPGAEKALGDQPIASGKLAMWVQVLSDWDSWKKYTKDDSLKAWFTDWPQPVKAKKDVWVGSIHEEAIWSQTKVRDAAWDFFIWRATNMDSLKYQITLFPVNYKMKEVVDAVITNPRQKDFLNGHLGLVGSAIGEYWGPSTTEIFNAFNAEIQNILLDKKSAEQAMKDATVAVNGILKG